MHARIASNASMNFLEGLEMVQISIHANTCMHCLYDFFRSGERVNKSIYMQGHACNASMNNSERMEMVKISIHARTCMHCLYDFFQSGERVNKSICMQGHACNASMICFRRDRDGINIYTCMDMHAMPL